MAETERKEQALLVGINNMEDEDDFDRSMEELERLAQACNMETVGILTQKLETVNNALYLGSGKVQELKEFAENIDADIIVFDNSLTPTQLRNLQQILKKPILDRTSLILDIFLKGQGQEKPNCRWRQQNFNICFQDWLVCMRHLADREEEAALPIKEPERKNWNSTDGRSSTGWQNCAGNWKKSLKNGRLSGKNA